MLDTFSRLSNEASLELIEKYLDAKEIRAQPEQPYEYLQSPLDTLQYSNLYPNLSFMISEHFLIKVGFSLEDEGKYSLEIYNTNSEYGFELHQIAFKLLNKDQKIYKQVEIAGGEIKSLSHKQVTHSYPLINDATHLEVTVSGNFGKSIEPQINQKELLKVQALIKEAQDQTYEVEKQKTVVDLLNMFQKALSSARSARESQGSSNQQQIKIVFSLSVSDLKLYRVNPFNESKLQKIKDPKKYVLAFESEVKINTLKQFLFQFKPLIKVFESEGCTNYFLKMTCSLPLCDPFEFILMIEQSDTNYLTIFYKAKIKLSVAQHSFLIRFGHLVMNYI